MIFKQSVKSMLVATGSIRAAGWLTAPKIVILRYHSIQIERKPDHKLLPASIVHTADEFDQHMAYIAKACNPITIEDVYRYLTSGKTPPRKSVAVTFDDGFYDNYSLAAPILEKYGVKGSFYIVAGLVDQRSLPWFCRTNFMFGETKIETWDDPNNRDRYDLSSQIGRNEARRAANKICARLTGVKQSQLLAQFESKLDVESPSAFDDLMMQWNNIRSLQSSGHIIGSHTVSHQNLTLLSKAELNQELIVARRRISEEVGVNITHFSYPNPIIQPHWNESVVNALKASGYTTGVTSTSGPVHVDNANPFALRRVTAPRVIGDFIWSIEASFAGRVI